MYMTVSALWLFLTVLWVMLQCVIVVFTDHTHLLFYTGMLNYMPTFKSNFASNNCFALPHASYVCISIELGNIT